MKLDWASFWSHNRATKSNIKLLSDSLLSFWQQRRLGREFAFASSMPLHWLVQFPLVCYVLSLPSWEVAVARKSRIVTNFYTFLGIAWCQLRASRCYIAVPIRGNDYTCSHFSDCKPWSWLENFCLSVSWINVKVSTLKLSSCVYSIRGDLPLYGFCVLTSVQTSHGW